MTGGRLVLYAAPLAIAMWILFPRIATPFWAVPIDTSSGTSGLSDTMSPGDISSLSLSEGRRLPRESLKTPFPHHATAIGADSSCTASMAAPGPATIR